MGVPERSVRISSGSKDTVRVLDVKGRLRVLRVFLGFDFIRYRAREAR